MTDSHYRSPDRRSRPRPDSDDGAGVPSPTGVGVGVAVGVGAASPPPAVTGDKFNTSRRISSVAHAGVYPLIPSTCCPTRPVDKSSAEKITAHFLRNFSPL